MVFYFRQLWNLVKPYKVRLFLGVLCGVLSGLANPLLMATVKVVTEVVFPATAATPLFSTPDPSLNRTNTPTTGPAPALAQPQAAADQNATLQRLPRIAREALARLSRLLPARKEPLSGAAIVLIVSAIPFAMFLRGFFAYLNIYFMAWVSIRTVTDLRTRLFAHLVNLSVSFFHRTSTGELITRINSVYVINLAINTSLSVIIREPVTIVSLLTLLILQQPRLTLVALMVFPLCIIPGIVYGRRVRKSSVAFQAQSIGLVDLMHETFTANRIVKAYNLEGRVVDQFGETSRQFVRHYMRMVRATELPGPMIEFMGAVGVAMFFLYIAFVTKQTPGDFLQFVGCIFLMYAPVKSLTRLHSQFAQSRVVIDAIFNLLQTTVTVPEPAQPKHLRAAGADVTFSTVMGEDAFKDFALDNLKKAGVKVNAILDRTRPTTNKNAFIADNYRLLKVDTLDNRVIAARILDQLRGHIADTPSDAVVFSDFRHGIFNPTTIPSLIAAIPAGRFRVADSQVASRWGNILDFSGFDLITPNEREARFALGDQDSVVRPLGLRLYHQAKCKTLILKMGERGLITYRSEPKSFEDVRAFFVVDSFAGNVVDAVGAGDALLAYATMVMANSGNPVIASVLGAMAAACECEYDGNIPIRTEDVRAKIDQYERRINLA